MTFQETFERVIIIYLMPKQPIGILYFQHDQLQDEFYENLKQELKLQKLYLEINILDEEKMKLF